MTSHERSYLAIEPSDLRRLADIAREDHEDLFSRKLDLGRLYRDRLLCVALCQGAALHFVDGTTGVKDFDVWSFFHAHPEKSFPYRRRVERDFGSPRFGTTPDRPDFLGRRVDLLGRSIAAEAGEHPASAVTCWLSSGSRSATLLAQKAVVLIAPEDLLGTVVWKRGPL